jgi:hypothetical protein
LKKVPDLPKQRTYRHNLQIYSKTSRIQGDVEEELIHPIPTIISGIISINGKQRTSVSRRVNKVVSKKNLVKVDSSRTSKPIKNKVVIIGDRHLMGNAMRLKNYLNSKFEVFNSIMP